MQEIITEARCCDNCDYNISRGKWKNGRCATCASRDGKTGWAPVQVTEQARLNKTWNPTTGCTPISPGCKICSAERSAKRQAGRNGYPDTKPFSVVLRPERLNQPVKWKKPCMVTVNSMGDLFHDDVPFEYLGKIFDVMHRSNNHIFQIRSKRPQRMLEFIQYYIKLKYNGNTSTYLRESKHVWIGISIENQLKAWERVPLLAKIPAQIRFVYCKPLGPLDLRMWIPMNGEDIFKCTKCGIWMSMSRYGIEEIRCPQCSSKHRWVMFVSPPIKWVVVDGWTGPGGKPIHPLWVKMLELTCYNAWLPFYFNGWGSWLPKQHDPDWAHKKGKVWSGIAGDERVNRNSWTWRRVTKKDSGCLLDGSEYKNMPVV